MKIKMLFIVLTLTSLPVTASSISGATVHITNNPNSLVIKPVPNKGFTTTKWTCSTTDKQGTVILGGTSKKSFAVAIIKPGETLTGSVAIVPHVAGGTKEECKALAVDTQGNIIVAGTVSDPTGNCYFGAARIKKNGTVDRSFGTNGIVCLSQGLIAGGINDQCNAVTIDGDTIILAGSAHDADQNTFFAVVQLTQQGTLNKNFGANGILIVQPTLGGGVNDQCFGVTIDNSHNIILTGTSAAAYPSYNSYFAATRIKQASTDTATKTSRRAYRRWLA